MRSSRQLIILPVTAGLILLGACATEPPPLDRTQPEAVPKAILDGTWYYNMTVTDADYDNPFTFIGEQTQTYMAKAFKIRWEVTKDRLNANMVPQVYLDPKGNPIENPYGQKSVILSFAITKHYDIRYRYNSTTREELNVIEENTDRPWQQREYMEVDWSKNLATNIWNPSVPEIASQSLEREDVAAYENVDFYARGPDGKESDVRIDTRKWRKDVDPEVYTINIDTKESITGKLRYQWQIYYGMYMEPTTVRFRHSLMKLPPQDQRTYQPKEYRDELFRRFGFFRTEFNVKDPERWDSVESGKKYLANRWDVSGEKQIAWYLSPAAQEMINNGDADLKTWAEEVVGTWNEVFKQATGRGDDVMVLRANEPLLDQNGEPITRADGTKRWKYELGDLRFPMMNVVSKQSNAQPLGYGPSVPDSDTGEIIHANMNLYAGWCEWVVRRAMDQYDVAAGNCSLDDIKNGRYWDPVKQKCCAGDPLPATSGPEPGKMGIAITGGGAPAPAGVSTPAPAPGLASLRFMSPALQTAWWPKTDTTKPIAEELLQEIAGGQPKLKLKAMMENELRQRTTIDLRGFQRIAGTAYESQLLPTSSLVSTAPYGNGPQDPDVLALLSPASRLTPDAMQASKEQLIKELATRDDPVMFEPAIHAFVEEMKTKKRDEVLRTVRHWIYYTGMLHEMGHTIGLRHNFMGSVDERNFPPEYTPARTAYWQKINEYRNQYAAKIKAGDSSAYEAYVRAVDNISSVKDRFGSSSIMDYHGDWMDWHLPARSYDRAAINFAYGDKVEVNVGGKWQWQPYKGGDFDQVNPLNPAEPAASGRLIRYYLFCSDEKVFDDAFCTMFDRGTTATEIARNFISDAQVSYFFGNFKRDRTGFDATRNGYYWRKFIRLYYMLVKPLPQLQINSMRYPEFFESIWTGINNMATQGPEKETMKPGYYRDGGEDLLRASLLVYYYLLYDVLMRPNYGYYARKVDTAGDRYWEEADARFLEEKATNVFVNAGAGWGFNDRWDVQTDSKRYYEHLQRIGVETDKVLAYEMLSIPAALNMPLYFEKANGLSFWNSIWTNNGSQLWEVTRGLISDNFAHLENPWCMKCDAACKADPKKNPPELKAYPVDYLEGLARAGIFTSYKLPTTKTRCKTDEEPLQPGMDALFAIKPIFYAIAGASHPWYHNALVEHLDSQVKGGLHRFDIPPGADVVEFTNPYGTKTYQAVQTSDKTSISYRIIDNARKIKNRADLASLCRQGKDNDPATQALIGSVGTFSRKCVEVRSCFPTALFSPPAPAWCEEEGWDPAFALEMLKYRDVERAEAMLIMMQDMIDIAGHYQWRVPGFFGGGD